MKMESRFNELNSAAAIQSAIAGLIVVVVVIPPSNCYACSSSEHFVCRCCNCHPSPTGAPPVVLARVLDFDCD